MSETKKFLKPGVDPVTGSAFAVYLPRKGRNISPDGESLVVDSYVEKRISTGELLEVTATSPAKKPVKEQTKNPTAGGEQ